MSTLKLITLITFLFPALAAAEQTLFVDFKHARLLHYYGNNQAPDSYPIVLPRYEVQQQMQLVRPIHGRVSAADHRPTWWPTLSMRQKDPTLPQAVRFGEARHPIGVYRLRIDWQNPVNPSFWTTVRIHGGAQEQHLHGRYSSGCIRMVDEHITRMVEIIKRYGGEVRVTFMPPQFL